MNEPLSLRDLLEILQKLESDYNEALANKSDYTNSSIRNLRSRIECYRAILDRRPNV